MENFDLMKNEKDSMFNYKLKGIMDKECLEIHKMELSFFSQKLTENTIDDFRKVLDSNEKIWGKDEKYQNYVKKTTTESIEIEGRENKKIKIYIHRPKEETKTKKKALLFFHGGGGVSFSAKVFKHICPRFVVENNIIIFNIEYGLAPENKSPSGIIDGYICFKYIYNNSEKFNIDKNSLGLTGESGGGYICTGVAMELAKKNESHLCKICIPVIPMTSNYFIKTDINDMNEFDRGFKSIHMGIYNLLADDLNKQINDPYLFPNLMSDSIAKKMPPTFVFTTEFDFELIPSKELIYLLKKNGTLLDYCIHPGVNHGWYIHFNTSTSHIFFDDFKKVVDLYL